MSEEHIDLNKLALPFPAEVIHWRVGATSGDKKTGIALAYVDARDVMRRLDEVVGRGNWQCDYPWSDTKRLVCRVGIKIGGEWIWKSNGAGDTQVEAEKGAFSDAFKRAAVLWGIAQYLYDLPNTWVELKPQGRSYVIADNAKKKLAKQLESGQQKKEPQKNWLAEIKNAKDELELHNIFKEAWENTKGKERDNIKAEYDKRKVEITELGGNSQAQRGE